MLFEVVAAINIPQPDTGEYTEGRLSWHLIAMWVMGGVALILVGAIAVGVFQAVSGKLTGSAERTHKGLTMAGLSLAGAVLLGSISGGIAWSARDGGMLAALMPAGARPQDEPFIVDRLNPVVLCPELVEVEGEDGHIRYLFVTLTGVQLHEVPDGVGDGPVAQEHAAYEIKWSPDGDAGDCDSSNTVAAAGSKIHVRYYGGAPDPTDPMCGTMGCESSYSWHDREYVWDGSELV